MEIHILIWSIFLRNLFVTSGNIIFSFLYGEFTLYDKLLIWLEFTLEVTELTTLLCFTIDQSSCGLCAYCQLSRINLTIKTVCFLLFFTSTNFKKYWKTWISINYFFQPIFLWKIDLIFKKIFIGNICSIF